MFAQPLPRESLALVGLPNAGQGDGRHCVGRDRGRRQPQRLARCHVSGQDGQARAG